MAASSEPQLTNKVKGIQYGKCTVGRCSCEGFERMQNNFDCIFCPHKVGQHQVIEMERNGNLNSEEPKVIKKREEVEGTFKMEIAEILTKDTKTKLQGKTIKTYSGGPNLRKHLKTLDEVVDANHEPGQWLTLLRMNMGDIVRNWHENLSYDWMNTVQGVERARKDMMEQFPQLDKKMVACVWLRKDLKKKEKFEHWLIKFEGYGKIWGMTEDMKKTTLLIATKKAMNLDLIELQGMSYEKVVKKLKKKAKANQGKQMKKMFTKKNTDDIECKFGEKCKFYNEEPEKKNVTTNTIYLS